MNACTKIESVAEARGDVARGATALGPLANRREVSAERSSMVKGVLLGFLAMAIFSCGDASIKAIGDRMTVFEISFFCTAFACIAIPFVKLPHERWRDMFRMHRPGLVMVRTIAGILAGLFSIYAFTTLPLAEVYSLIFLSPLLVTILSIPFLGETVGWRRALAILVGFAGVLLVVRPGFREMMPGHLAAAAAAMCGAATVLSLRALGPTEKRITLMGVVFVAALAVNGAIMIFDFHVPAPRDFLLTAFAGLCGGTAHTLLMAAMRAAPANRVAPTQYSQIAWAIILGALFFGEFPDATAVAGIVLVTFAGLFTFAREEKRGVRFPSAWTMVFGRSGRSP
jgi:S-adenosylmethionine uptake transporter